MLNVMNIHWYIAHCLTDLVPKIKNYLTVEKIIDLQPKNLKYFRLND